MQKPGEATRKFYTSPSVPAFNLKTKGSMGEQYFGQSMTKPTRFRRTDHTEDKDSEVSNSRMNNNYCHYGDGVVQEGDEPEETAQEMYHVLGSKEQISIQLQQRMKNIHHFYKIRIEEQRTKNMERNQMFISIIEELQYSQNNKMLTLQRSLEELESGKQQVPGVEEKMTKIKETIESILHQSKLLKEDNQVKQKQILEIRQKINDKQGKSNELREELDSLRNKLEQFERLKLKENRRIKQLVEMVDTVRRPA